MKKYRPWLIPSTNSIFNQQQQALLESLPPEDREFQARLFRIGNASYRYYLLAKSEPTKENHESWLEGLPENIRRDFRQRGFEECADILGLRRHAAERNDVGMDKFLQEHLSAEDYAYQRTLSESAKEAP